MNAVDEQVKKTVPWTDEQVIHFSSGVPGFDGAKKFIIYTLPEHEPFHWLECIDGQKIKFAIINPLIFRQDYSPKISKEELDTLHIKDPKDLLMYVIVTLNQPLNASTANLMGPLFINIRERMGKQIIIENEAYSLRERIIK